MKKTIIYCITAVTALLVSCGDFLVEKPRTQFSKSQVYSTVEGAQAALNGCYSYISNSYLYGQKMHVVLGCGSGTMTAGTSSAYFVELAKLNIYPTNSAVDEVWSGTYQAICAINDVLINLPPSDIDAVEKQRIMGEANFLRALLYFNLARMFGPVPLVTEPGKSYQELHRPRTPLGEIYNLILTDLGDAWDRLPDPGTQPKGRPQKYAAKALLAKVFVAMACIKEHPGDPFDASWLDKSAREYWQDAYDAASDVEQHSGYDLVGDFARLWDCYNKYTVESIFELEENVAAGSTTFMYHYLPGYWEGLPLTGSNNNYGRIRAMRESWDEHYYRYLSGDVHDYRLDVTYIDSLYKTNSTTGNNAYPNTYQAVYPYVSNVSTTVADGNEFPLPPGTRISSSDQLLYVKKYADPQFTAYDANVNVIVLRYADLLLTLAEAANELDLTPEAVGYVNRLLRRARNTPNGQRPQPADWPLDMSKEDFRKNIMIERRLELKAELHEWFDNRRRGSEGFREIILAHNERLDALPIDDSKTPPVPKLVSYDFYFDEDAISVKKNLLLPFPASEISANSSISESDQNYGYQHID